MERSLRKELPSLNIKTLKAIAASMDLSIENVIEKSEKKTRYHKKRSNPIKYTVPHKEWDIGIVRNVMKIPYNIDGFSSSFVTV